MSDDDENPCGAKKRRTNGIDSPTENAYTAVKMEPDSEAEEYPHQLQFFEDKGNDSVQRPAEDIEDEKNESDDEDDLRKDIDRDTESPSNFSKGSVLGVDYTVKEVSVSTPDDESPSKGKKTRRRNKVVAKTYYCALCDFNSPRWDRLKEHLIVHLEDRPFVCEICDFKTKTAKKLKRHQTVHSLERKFECSLCNLSFKRAHTLKEHELTHSKEKLFFCSVCDYSTHRSQYLKRHMMKHTNDTLQCEFCQFKTVYATLLRRHLQIHTGEKIYKCTLCNYSSVYLHCVSQHKRTHDKGTQYECGVCDFTTTSHSSLRTHMYMHANGSKKFRCNFCVYSSMRKCDVKRHQLKVHKDRIADIEKLDIIRDGDSVEDFELTESKKENDDEDIIVTSDEKCSV